MNNDDLKGSHDDYRAQTETPEGMAEGIDLSSVTDDELRANKKSVLLLICNRMGIDAEYANVSPSKWGKLNKDELVDLIRQKQSGSVGSATEAGTVRPSETVDIFGSILDIKGAAQHAIVNKDYSGLDRSVMEIMTKGIESSGGGEVINRHADKIGIALAIGGAAYFAARFYGFDNVKKLFKKAGVQDAAQSPKL